MGVDLTQLSPWLLVVAPLAVVAAYFVLGLSGFGSTVVSVPILAHFLPISFLVPLMAVIDLASTLLIGSADRRHIAFGEIKWLLPFMFAGFGIGVWLLVGAPDEHLRLALGLFVLAIGAHAIRNPVLTRRISRLWSVPAGLFGGSMATVFGAGGPIYASYLSGRIGEKDRIRATASAMVSISTFSRAVIYALSGLLLHPSVLIALAVLAPFAWIGLTLGRRVHVGLTNEQMRRVVGTILLAAGVSLVLRGLLR